MKKIIYLSFLLLIISTVFGCATAPIESPELGKFITVEKETIELPQYKVGDMWEWKWVKGREGNSWINRVIEVKENEVLAETRRKYKLFLDKQYNLLQAKTPSTKLHPEGEDATHIFWWERWFWYKEFPLYPGKSWMQKQTGPFSARGRVFTQDYDIEYCVEGFEEVKVRAGTFIALRILFKAMTEHPMEKLKVTSEVTLWYSPEVKNYIKGVWGKRWVDQWQGVEFNLLKYEVGR
jgi:hypothetical protein